jgi:rhodanese-related sulfurtransferase
MLNKLLYTLAGLFSFSSFAITVDKVEPEVLLKLDQAAYTLIDVRTPKEYQQGHIPGAINIPLSDIQSDASTLGLPKETNVVLYCRSGYRAGKAAKVLRREGFKQLQHLDGDMLGWQKAGRPVAQPKIE